MKCGFLINAIGCIDGKLVDEAENYKPKRRMPAWIWAASAACLCVVVLFAALLVEGIPIPVGRVNEAALNVVLGGKAEHGYVDYRARAEKGKVLITDELKSLMEEHKEQKPRFGYISVYSYAFMVRITDANGAAVPPDCLPSTKKKSDEDRVEFVQKGIVTLSEKEIYSVKASPELALIISPAVISIDEEYLNTVNRDSLDVWVALKFDEEFLNEYEYLEEYDQLDSEARNELIEGQIARFFEKEFGDHVELDEDFKKFLEEYDSFDIEIRHRNFIKHFSRLMYQKCTEHGIEGDSIRGYRETGGHVDLDMNFQSFIHEERVYWYFEKYAGDYGIDIDSIKEYREISGTFNAELDTEIIAKILQDERTRVVYVSGVL